MDEMLSQEEINALLKGLDSDDAEGSVISETEKDAIGEVSNNSMGTAATTLFSLVNQKVVITTPIVEICRWEDINSIEKPCVSIQIVYKEGLEGTNILILKEHDVKIITDLMMGGDGTNTENELSELHLSAISEAMNQMIGSASTSMSSMFNKKIDINPPISNYLDFNETIDPAEIAEFLTKEFIKVSFNLQIGDLVDSEMMQLYPIEFAKNIYSSFVEAKVEDDVVEEEPAPKQEQNVQNNMGNNAGMQAPQNNGAGMQVPPNGMVNNGGMQMPPNGMGNGGMQMPPNGGMPYPQNPYPQNMGMPQQNNQYRNIEVQQAQFQNFDMNAMMQQKENIDLIMDVPLEITVELGRTHKSIQDILEFAPGTIIELNKLAGEPIDVLVNGKIVAKGEVVVIEENFSIRVTDIIKQSGQIL
jgi:flagellar motor switch protein FliN/FliY